MFVLTACTSPQIPTDAIQVSLDDLIERPNRFAGKRVVVSGYWIRGFEWSYLSGRQDVDSHSPIWVEGGRTGEQARAIREIVTHAYERSGKQIPWDSRDLWIRCVGKFSHTDGPVEDKEGHLLLGFGHMGVYRSQLEIEELLEARIVPEPRNESHP